MSNMENETMTDLTNEQSYFDVTDKGVVSLKAEYRGDKDNEHPEYGSEGTKLALPDLLVIPDMVENTQVQSLADGMFYNNKRVKEITLPETVTVIPANFCRGATNLRIINGTENIKNIGDGAFGFTRIKEALFPGLTSMDIRAFAYCGYLRVADIGTVSEIPSMTFYNCALLQEVRWKQGTATDNDQTTATGKVSIGASAFHHTRSLRELPLLEYADRVEKGAFLNSRISAVFPKCNWFGEKASPSFDNMLNFWTGAQFTPCRNRLITKLSQMNAQWAKKKIWDGFSPKYEEGCALFATMHIHSAITGKHYAHPDRFVEELRARELSDFLKYTNWPGDFENAAPLFEALGHRVEVYGTASDLSREDYQAMVDALAQGAYIYAQTSEFHQWIQWNNPDGGHAVVIYGINELGEVCVLDSLVLHEHYREDGFEPDADLLTYTIPFQNLVGPSSNFVIVYPDGGSENAFSLNTDPSDLPVGINVASIATSTELNELHKSKTGYLTAYRLFSNANLAVEEWQPNGSSKKYVRYTNASGGWSDWEIVYPTTFDNNVNSTTSPDALSKDLYVSLITKPADPEAYDDTQMLPERKNGYLTVYRPLSNVDYAMEVWQPYGSRYKYVRHAMTAATWSDWYVAAPTVQVSEE